MITPDRNASSTPLDPSRRSLLRAMVAIPATALVLGELPGLLGSAAAAAPPTARPPATPSCRSSTATTAP